MLSILCVRLTIKVKVGISESFKVGRYPPQKTGSSHLKLKLIFRQVMFVFIDSAAGVEVFIDSDLFVLFFSLR